MNLQIQSSKKKKVIDFDVSNEYFNNSLHRSQFSTVKDLVYYVKPISSDMWCLDVLTLFSKDTTIFTVPIVNENNIPVGLISRGRLTELFFKPYARDLHHKKTIGEIMQKDAVIVDTNTSIDDLANITINAGMLHMVNGFIVVERGSYIGMATGQKLLEEITYRKQQDLHYLAHFDQLTGLPNRLLFKDRLLQSIQQAKRTNKLFSLIFVDLDRFKYINDTLGHSFGDELLRIFSQKLTVNVRESDTVARLGGDEFVIILQNLVEAKDAEKIALDIIEYIRKPMLIYDQEIQITASLGVALYPMHDDSLDGLLRKADAAMYEVKEKGRNNYAMYSDVSDCGFIQRNSLEVGLRMALNKNEFSLYYQPQINLESNEVVGVEALLRWHHNELGLIPPAQFIPIAEESGLIISIGEWVLNEACRQQVDWISQGLPPLRIAVNVSAIQFRQNNFFDCVKKAIDNSGIDPSYLELELTESLVMTNPLQTVSMLNKIRSLGIKFAIDDFGTGHSSLSYLTRFPIDKLKIDQSFIRNIQGVPGNEAIVRAIIALGSSLGLEIIAEGVETLDELDCIKNYNCQEVQGYFFSRPIPADDFKAWHQDVMKG
ncbi:putative bifunctional diguanylate cyclase/phosphodiesterase [Methylobacter psychrophilus]|uniref:putative bifunctional diguanylate cyclase/phosphodiesterase n=1 Tax=Methylobacter psychrophilus TaxID=96941 RepID=UPI0021D4C9C4|nr:EAL domain-containing protein [Methylobacter psychrophilus]